MRSLINYGRILFYELIHFINSNWPRKSMNMDWKILFFLYQNIFKIWKTSELIFNVTLFWLFFAVKKQNNVFFGILVLFVILKKINMKFRENFFIIFEILFLCHFPKNFLNRFWIIWTAFSFKNKFFHNKFLTSLKTNLAMKILKIWISSK